MNSQFKLTILQYLRVVKREGGFTLIELLVTMTFLSLLMAIVMPNIIGQIAKGRQAEAKSVLGIINRAQQSYKGEKGTFTTLNNTSLGVSANGQFYTFAGPASNNINYAAHTATAVAIYSNDIKNYASAVATDNNTAFSTVICESLGSAASGQGAVAPGSDYTAISGSNPCVTGIQIN